MFNKKPKETHKKNWLLGAFLFFYLTKKLFSILRRKRLGRIEENFKDFLKKEEKEIKEYTHGKETLAEFAQDSGSIFRDYFIPHTGNNHMPKILHHRSLALITLLAFAAKFVLVAYLYFVFPYAGKADGAMIAKIIELLNADRNAAGLSSLKMDSVLTSSAQKKVSDMVEKDYFSHTSPDGRKPWDFVDRGQYAYAIVGENLAMNFSSGESAHKALMASPSHKKNIMNEKYQDIGLAMLKGRIGGKETNVLVQLFSTRVSVTPAPEKVIAKEEPVVEPVKNAPETAVTENQQANDVRVLSNQKIAPTETMKPEPAKPVSQEIVKQATQAIKKQPIEAIEQPKTMTKPAETPVLELPRHSLEVSAGQARVAVLEESSTSTKIALKSLTVINHPGDQLLSDNAKKLLDDEFSAISEKEKTMPAMIASTEFAGEEYFLLSERFIYASRVFMAALLSLLIISLLLNIFIRIEIQHKPVLVRSLVAVFFVASLLFVNFHYLEGGNLTVLLS